MNITNLLLQHGAIVWKKPERNAKYGAVDLMGTQFPSNSTT